MIKVPEQAKSVPYKREFSPYANNGGTTLGIPGPDWVVVAGDTRLSQGYGIQTRMSPKLKKLTPHCVISSAGCQTDMTTLWKVLQYRIGLYRNRHGKDMSAKAIAQMLSKILYSKRFFPYYTFNMVCGVIPTDDNSGYRGVVYGFDAVGSYQEIHAGCDGSGQTMIQPLLDSQRSFKNQLLVPDEEISLDYAKSLVRDAFANATERDIYTGDFTQILTITKDGIQEEWMEMRQD